MQVKIFEAPDMTTGLKRIREELGPDALILSTRTRRDGPLGLLGKPILEITAATDGPINGSNAVTMAERGMLTAGSIDAAALANVPASLKASPRASVKGNLSAQSAHGGQIDFILDGDDGLLGALLSRTQENTIKIPPVKHALSRLLKHRRQPEAKMDQMEDAEKSPDEIQPTAGENGVGAKAHRTKKSKITVKAESAVPRRGGNKDGAGAAFSAKAKAQALSAQEMFAQPAPSPLEPSAEPFMEPLIESFIESPVEPQVESPLEAVAAPEPAAGGVAAVRKNTRRKKAGKASGSDAVTAPPSQTSVQPSTEPLTELFTEPLAAPNRELSTKPSAKSPKKPSGKAVAKQSPAMTPRRATATIPSQAPALPPILSYLQARGIEAETADALARYARQRLTPGQRHDPQAIRACLIDAVQNFISVAPPDFTDTQKRIALVGPTGVGKTTTIAKLAAWYMARHHGKLVLITIDTYRIAAVEQLKVYGEIMRLPVEVVIDSEQLAACLRKHRDAALILIDTSGHSPQNTPAVAELGEFFSAVPAIEKHLVLSATTREDELLHSLQAFEPLAVERTIFTKIDECLNLGVLLNVHLRNTQPLSFLTNGQRVPEDLLEIDRRKVAELILPEGA